MPDTATPPDSPPKGITRRRATLRLPVALTDEDLVARALRLAQLEAELEDLSRDQKAATELIRAQRKDLAKAKAETLRELSTRKALAAVECDLTVDSWTCRAMAISVETGEKILDRALAQAERQADLVGERLAEEI